MPQRLLGVGSLTSLGLGDRDAQPGSGPVERRLIVRLLDHIVHAADGLEYRSDARCEALLERGMTRPRPGHRLLQHRAQTCGPRRRVGEALPRRLHIRGPFGSLLMRDRPGSLLAEARRVLEPIPVTE